MIITVSLAIEWSISYDEGKLIMELRTTYPFIGENGYVKWCRVCNFHWVEQNTSMANIVVISFGYTQ